MNTLKSLVRKRIRSKKLSMVEREKLPTYYPSAGYGEIAQKIAAKVRALGGKIHLNHPVNQILTSDDRTVISTLPLPVLIHMLEPSVPDEILVAAQLLEYRPLLVLGIVTDKQPILDCHYMYFLNRPYNRVSEMNQFRGAAGEENILSVEIPCRRNDRLWKSSDEDLLTLCMGSLETDGILKRTDVKRIRVLRAAYAYPVYRLGYEKPLKTVLDYLAKFSQIKTLGRSGEFMYMDADHCIRRAFDLAKDLPCEYAPAGV